MKVHLLAACQQKYVRVYEMADQKMSKCRKVDTLPSYELEACLRNAQTSRNVNVAEHRHKRCRLRHCDTSDLRIHEAHGRDGWDIYQLRGKIMRANF